MDEVSASVQVAEGGRKQEVNCGDVQVAETKILQCSA